MIRIRVVLLFLSATLLLPAPAAQRDKAERAARPLAAPAEAKADMARYSLKAYGELGSDTVGGVVSGGVHSYLIYYAA